MSIVEKIRASVKAATKMELLYHSAETLNTIADNAEFPCAIMLLLQQGQVEAGGKQLRERVDAAVFFVDKTQFDFSSKENEEIIQQCKQRAHKWLSSLYGNHDLYVRNVGASERLYDYLDVTLTGYGINITLEEVEGDVIC